MKTPHCSGCIVACTECNPDIVSVFRETAKVSYYRINPLNAKPVVIALRTKRKKNIGYYVEKVLSHKKKQLKV